jgi:purine-binding chemotaxis protein CheW
VNKLIVGLTVDSLKEIIALSEENIKPTPEVAAMQMEADVTSGLARIGERIIPILDLAHIITKKEATELSGLER